ncbi:hypothetical protein C1646_225404 [Rhizophagus diaphanus]|nr:hypothetical protein C1646_225404 [Rhizophagus diaphanus] [Rhizophagus sp. MUCL 43196]
MRYRGSFSYINNSVFVVRITRTIRMKIRATGQGAGIIYFRRRGRRRRRRANIPPGFQLRQMGGPILTPFQRGTYQIVWTNSYELLSNGVPVFRLRQQMQQSIECDIYTSYIL